MSGSCGFQDMTRTDQNTFPQQHWNVATFHEKFQICINPFTSQFNAKKCIIKTIRSALKQPLKINKFVTNITFRNHMVTNLNFNNGYGYFDTIFIYAGNTFLSSIVLC